MGWITVKGVAQSPDLVVELRLMFQAGMQSRGMLMYNDPCRKMSLVDSDEQNEFSTNEVGLAGDCDFESRLTSRLQLLTWLMWVVPMCFHVLSMIERYPVIAHMERLDDYLVCHY